MPVDPSVSVPTAPDFLLCNAAYGAGLRTADCGAAALIQFAEGQVPFPYVDHQTVYLSHTVPFEATFGGCIIRVQFADHSAGSTLMWIIPNDLRTLTSQIIRHCVTEERGIGGFATLGLAGAIAFVDSGTAMTDIALSPWPAYTHFLTITVSSVNSPEINPGNTDPSIPIAIGTEARGHVPGLIDTCIRTAQMMQRGSSRTWYDTHVSAGLDHMSYQCDKNLGSPSEVDCTQIEWSQFGPGQSGSNTLAVSPGAPTFLHSNTCYLAISAALSVILTWAQIQTAVSTLMNTCIQAPFHPVQGGRAYYSPSPSHRKRQAASSVTGLDALPPTVNITMFEQHEPWPGSAAAELRTCAWQAVLAGLTVSHCPDI